MKNGMDRRDFLKASMATGAVLLAGHTLHATGSAQSALKFAEVEKVTITVITDNYYDQNRPGPSIGSRYRATPGKSIHAEAGISYYVETVAGGQSSSFMFDYGIDAQGVMRNMELLGITLDKVDGLGLSHGHWDHYGTLLANLRANQAKIPKGTPLYLGEETFAHRFSTRPGTTQAADLGRLSMEEIESIGVVRVVEVKEPTPVMKGGYFTGKIERVTDYEKIPPTLVIKRGEKLEPDSFIGEQALIFNVKGKGLVVLSACGHRGMVNTVRHAQKISGIEKVHAVLGGLHLSGGKPEIIEKTVAGIKAIGPDYIVPAHCTGFETATLFAKEMPKQFILNTAAARYTFAA